MAKKTPKPTPEPDAEPQAASPLTPAEEAALDADAAALADDNEPGVMGAGDGPPPMPTSADRDAAAMRLHDAEIESKDSVPLERDALPTADAARAEEADRAEVGAPLSDVALDDPPPTGPAPDMPLRTDGPTLEEYVAAGYKAENYPPFGYAAKPSPSPITNAEPVRRGFFADVTKVQL